MCDTVDLGELVEPFLLFEVSDTTLETVPLFSERLTLALLLLHVILFAETGLSRRLTVLLEATRFRIVRTTFKVKHIVYNFILFQTIKFC